MIKITQNINHMARLPIHNINDGLTINLISLFTLNFVVHIPVMIRIYSKQLGKFCEYHQSTNRTLLACGCVKLWPLTSEAKRCQPNSFHLYESTDSKPGGWQRGLLIICLFHSVLFTSDLFYQERLKDRQQHWLLAFLFKHMFVFGFHPLQFKISMCDKVSNALSLEFLLSGQDTHSESSQS